MNSRAHHLSVIVSLAFLALGIWPLVRPLTSLESWLPTDRLILVSHSNVESTIVEQVLESPQLQERAIVIPSSSSSTVVASASCKQLASVLAERHPSFGFAPESLLCYLARGFADDLLVTGSTDGRDVFLFEGFSPVPPEFESEAWARYGLKFEGGGLQIVGRGRRPGPGPGYNREIGY
jgi:hypothetical protein